MRMSDVGVVGRATASGALHAAGMLGLAGSFRERRGQRRIAFQAYAIHLAQCYVPVIAQLRRDAPDVEIDFVVLPHPHFPWRSLRALRDFAIDVLGVPRDHVRFGWQAVWSRYDLLVCTDVFASFPLRHTKTVLLKHGVGISRRAVAPHPLRKTVFDFDLVLVSGDADREALLHAAPPTVAPSTIVAAGLPYVDRLDRDDGTRETYLHRLGLNPAEAVVLVAPSWRGLIAAGRKQPRYLDDIVQSLLDLGLQTIVKLHACSLNSAMAGGEDWAATLERYRRQGAFIDDDVDDVPALRHADLLITDISSRAYNFLLLDKPVVLALPDDFLDDQLDRDRIRALCDGTRVVRSATELRSLLAHGIRDLAAIGNGAASIVARSFANRGHATDAVVAELLRQVDAAG